MDNTRKIKTANSTEIAQNEASEAADSLRTYSRPQVLSAEGLEAAAVVCAPPTFQGPGKSVPVPCGTLGS